MRKGLQMGLVVGALAATLATGVFVGEAIAYQPHMRAALDDLSSARDELRVAGHNKGGHRLEALRLTNEAMGEVRAGIDAGDDD